MNDEKIKKLFVLNGLSEPQSIYKVAVGFTNDVYMIDNTYVLKICKDSTNKDRFKNEAIFYTFYKEKIPVPAIIIYDDRREFTYAPYIIYKKIDGNNLYNEWHLYTNKQRRSVVKQLSGILKIINNTNIDELPSDVSLTKIVNWKDTIISKINDHIFNLLGAATISQNQAEQIQKYINANQSVLDKQKLALVYWDAHFDNILVRGGKIVGLIDFEHTEIASIDFTLDIVKRMVNQPKKYMSEYAEQFAQLKDYAHLLEWFREYYPELFEFEHIDTRLDIYAIEHDLKDLEGWPEATDLLNRIMRIVKKLQ